MDAQTTHPPLTGIWRRVAKLLEAGPRTPRSVMTGAAPGQSGKYAGAALEMWNADLITFVVEGHRLALTDLGRARLEASPEPVERPAGVRRDICFNCDDGRLLGLGGHCPICLRTSTEARDATSV